MEDYKGLVKSLRWLSYMFPETHPAKDDTDRISNNIHLYCKSAADAIEELSKRINGVTAERDAAMKRLCQWCEVGCSMEARRAELCEIAAVGPEFLADDCTSTDWATCQPEVEK
jgi:hypothetical protein